jgi:hypothetical protein
MHHSIRKYNNIIKFILNCVLSVIIILPFFLELHTQALFYNKINYYFHYEVLQVL